ncbi:hypothetical protein L1887_53004 [Cichorium endivia]|nr:hypothetical protein L1887_53004 [Cichorium endivia]
MVESECEGECVESNAASAVHGLALRMDAVWSAFFEFPALVEPRSPLRSGSAEALSLSPPQKNSFFPFLASVRVRAVLCCAVLCPLLTRSPTASSASQQRIAVGTAVLVCGCLCSPSLGDLQGAAAKPSPSLSLFPSLSLLPPLSSITTTYTRRDPGCLARASSVVDSLETAEQNRACSTLSPMACMSAVSSRAPGRNISPSPIPSPDSSFKPSLSDVPAASSLTLVHPLASSGQPGAQGGALAALALNGKLLQAAQVGDRRVEICGGANGEEGKGNDKCTAAHLDTALAGTTLHLLARDLGTSTTGADRLGLGRLACLGLRLLVLLALGNGGLAGGSTDLGLLVAAGVDHVERSADNATLVLDSLARALLGDLLGDTLLVKTTVHSGPGNLTGVLALQEERLVLRADKAEHLVVTADVKTTLTTVGVRTMHEASTYRGRPVQTTSALIGSASGTDGSIIITTSRPSVSPRSVIQSAQCRFESSQQAADMLRYMCREVAILRRMLGVRIRRTVDRLRKMLGRCSGKWNVEDADVSTACSKRIRSSATLLNTPSPCLSQWISFHHSSQKVSFSSALNCQHRNTAECRCVSNAARWNATVTVVMLVVVQQRWSQAKDRVHGSSVLPDSDGDARALVPSLDGAADCLAEPGRCGVLPAAASLGPQPGHSHPKMKGPIQAGSG